MTSQQHNNCLIVVMGVSGCGKSTIGCQLADALAIPFRDADDFHSQANVQKMANGIPLDDQDREPWLRSIVDFAAAEVKNGKSIVVACSALKKKYRDQLRQTPCPVWFVHLTASFELIHQRLAARKDHFMTASLLESQFEALESPAGEARTLEVSVDQPVAAVVDEALRRFNLANDAESE